MRIIPGSFQNLEHRTGPVFASRFAPAVDVTVQWQDSETDVEFLIDTGCEFTTLFPRASMRLLGDAFSTLDFTRQSGSDLIAGIEGLLSVTLPIDVKLVFYDEIGDSVQLDTTVSVVEPNPSSADDLDASRGNWDTPSLLGRDLLLYFDLHVVRSEDSVYLSLPD